METITAKQIQTELVKELTRNVTTSQLTALNTIGYSEVPDQRYRDKYPLHKIVSSNRITTICEKYNLKFVGMDEFVGIIPERNIIEIDNFVNSYVKKQVRTPRLLGDDYDWIPVNQPLVGKQVDRGYRNYEFYIIAPASQVVTKKQRIDVGVEVEDPIILAREASTGSNNYIVVTAWGDEANDVVNPINN